MTAESTQPAPYVFLSYASADRERALHIADLLETSGVPVWMDRKSIAGGSSWSAEIVRGIRGCTAFAVVCSPPAMASPNVQQEIQLAFESRRPILPLVLERSDLPEAVAYALAGRQWVEVLDHPDAFWLPAALRGLRGLGVELPHQPEPTGATPSAPAAKSFGQSLASSSERAPRHNLPVQVTSFVGRERELTEGRERLRGTHLLTLTGAGGCGKTRLALQIAGEVVDDFADGAWLVELAPVSTPELVPQTLASVLGVQENPGTPLVATLIAYLRPRSALLILDNCEHLIDASAQLADTLIRACPELRILATSRELLGVAGETPWRVPPLEVPDPRTLAATGPEIVDLVSRFEAVQLFLQRAVAVAPEFRVTEPNARALAQICRRLDGIPLAIELAAARVRVLTVEQIAARLDQRFRLLTGGSRAALPRQQTLAALVGWSYDLLTDAERILFTRLAVFVDGFTLAAAEAVGSGDGIEDVEVLDLLLHLVDKSLVAAEPGKTGEARYRLLETLRQFGREKLVAASGVERVQERHAAYFLTLTERATRELIGPERNAWLRQLTAELGNLRAALQWAIERGDVERGLAASEGVGQFWFYHGYPAEGRVWLVELLGTPAAQARTGGRARALSAAGFLAWQEGALPAARSNLAEALAIAREVDDRDAISWALTMLGRVEVDSGELSAGRAALEEGLAISRSGADVGSIGSALLFLGTVTYKLGDYALARAYLTEALAVARQSGEEHLIATILNWLGHLATTEGQLQDAGAIYTESLTHRLRLDYPMGIAFTLAGLANLAAARSNHARAARLAGVATRLCGESGVPAARMQEAGIRERLERARDDIGSVAYDAAFAEGEAMTLDEAVAYALEEDSG